MTNAQTAMRTFSRKTMDRKLVARTFANEHHTTIRQARKYLQDRDLPKADRRWKDIGEWIAYQPMARQHDQARMGGVTRRR